jgi:hypothetical protein
VHLVVHAKHVSGIHTATDVKPKEEAKKLLVEDPDDFVIQYGDTYISSMELGGEYFAVYSFHSETRSEKESLKAELEASGFIKAVSLGGEFSSQWRNSGKAAGSA